MPTRIDHTLGQSLSLYSGSALLFTLTYGGLPKPCIHPLSTPAGHVLTNFEPSDHLWHRGLWFTFKFLNGENFWEEKGDPTEGALVVKTPPAISHPAPGVVAIHLEVDWVRHTGQVILKEHRTITYRPHTAAAYLLDHKSVLTPHADILLDRTPFTTWGGYGGLCFRATRNWLNTNILLSTGESTLRPVGTPARWAVLSGALDGGKDLTASLAILDHPNNPRHPTPFYGSANNPNHYLTPAPLFHEPLQVHKDQPLAFAYRVIPHQGLLTPDQLTALADDFARS